MSDSRSLTTRRGFLAAASFGVVSLYGLWAAFGAAPLPFGNSAAPGGPGTGSAGDAAAGHGGHGAAVGPSADAFRRQTEAFVERYRLPDGSVRPARTTSAAAEDPHAGHGTVAGRDDAHADHDDMAAPEPAHDHAAAEARSVDLHTEDEPIEVYLMAYQWGFEPAELRLEAGQPYRFRMMAVDSSHGAALQLGAGSRIIRLRRNVLVESVLTFQQPGEILVYCTLFCGPGHDQMLGRILVA